MNFDTSNILEGRVSPRPEDYGRCGSQPAHGREKFIGDRWISITATFWRDACNRVLKITADVAILLG